MRKSIISAAVLAIGLAACDSPESAVEMGEADMGLDAGSAETQDEPIRAMATLMSAEGQEVGNVLAMETDEGLTIAVEATDIPAGTHGAHVHQTGSCEPDFTAAGGHWNPTDQSHGLEGPEGQHAGDMPNLEVGEDGSGSLQYTLQGGASFDGLMDSDGSAFVIHAGEDDQMTDPSGDSGDRIACGVFEQGGTAPASSSV